MGKTHKGGERERERERERESLEKEQKNMASSWFVVVVAVVDDDFRHSASFCSRILFLLFPPSFS